MFIIIGNRKSDFYNENVFPNDPVSELLKASGNLHTYLEGRMQNKMEGVTAIYSVYRRLKHD